MIFALLSFTFVAHAQSVSFTPDVAGNPQNFGSVTAGQTSAPRSFTVSGSGLIDDVTINIPSRFQGSLSPTTGFGTTAIVLSPSGGTLAPTTIYLRFAPNAAGQINRTVFAFTLDSNGDVVASSPTIALTGTGTAASPSIGVSPGALGFGNQVVNTQSTPQQVTVTGTSLTSTIAVNAPTGFLVSYNGGAYASSTTLPAAGGTVDVVFLPNQTGNFVGNITFNSTGAAQATVSVSGTGVPVPGNLSTTYSPNPLDFGQAQVGTSTASQSFVVNGSALSSDVTITPSANFQIRIGSNPFSSNPLVLTTTNGSIGNVTVDVRFTPTQNVAVNTVITETIALTAANANASVNVRGEATPAPNGASVTVMPTSIDFGPITGSGSASTRTLTVSGTGLGTNPITLTPNSPYIQIRNASTGGNFGSSLTIASNNGTVPPTTVEVRIAATATSAVPGGPFSQIINVSSPGATTVPVTVTANSNGNISDISITNPNNNTFTFATRPGTFSAAQSFLISGTNLLQDITIGPAGTSGGFFQISKDGLNFTNSDTLKRNGQNNVPQRQIFVRFVPGSQAITVNALIRASSSPAPDQDVSVTGISEPTIRLLEPIGSFGTTVVKNTTSPTRTVRLETFLLTGPTVISFPNDNQDPQRNPDRTPQFEFRYSTGGGPGQANGNYVYTDTLGNNAEGNRIIDLLVRYHPTRVGASTQDLQFTNAALSGGAPFALLSQNGRATGFAIAEEPTAQSTAQIIRSNDRTQASITFDLTNAPSGQSYGQKRLVIASRTYTLLPTSLFPQDKQNFNPGTTVGGVYQYGTGTLIEQSSGTYVVFSGAANSFTVGNLNAGEEYYFYAFEFNDDGLLNAENYKVPNNQPQTPLPVELVSFTAELRNGRVNLNWVTAQEKNNRGFQVERSKDGRTFSKIDFVAGNGTTTSQKEYSSVDLTPLMGTSYYRLRQIDTDGAEHTSDMVAVFNGSKADVTVFPNPVSDVLNVRVAGAGIDTKVVVTDMMGRVVLNGKLSLNGTFDVSQLKAGNYIVTVINGGEKTSHKVVKQ